MKLTILGSGSPEAYLRRASSGYLVEVGPDRILFDCGGGVFDNLLRSGRLPSDVTHIVFFHLHSDHMMDYARLVHAAWDEGGAPIKCSGRHRLRPSLMRILFRPAFCLTTSAPAPNCRKAKRSGPRVAAPCRVLGQPRL